MKYVISVLCTLIVLAGISMPHALVFADQTITTPTLDMDGDGLIDDQERTIYHTDPTIADTDGDGYNDGQEIKNGYSPLVKDKKLIDVDTDKDGLNDDWEIKLKSDLTNKDTDGDGIADGKEVMDGTSPTSTDKRQVTKNIEVDIKAFKLTYYQDGVALATIPVSTGTKAWPTPRGTFHILKKKPVVNYSPIGDGKYLYPGTKWNLHFTSTKYMYFIHGAYWHNEFGKKNVSHGCVNVAYADMDRLYNWAQVGTTVHLY